LLVSSHDWGSALDQYDRVIVLDGRVLADGSPDQIRHRLGDQLDPGAHCHD
jgi:zinc/manganese transport system ATP-binding protein